MRVTPATRALWSIEERSASNCLLAIWACVSMNMSVQSPYSRKRAPLATLICFKLLAKTRRAFYLHLPFCISQTRRCGEIGRRARLKILWASPVSVRVRPPAPFPIANSPTAQVCTHHFAAAPMEINSVQTRQQAVDSGSGSAGLVQALSKMITAGRPTMQTHPARPVRRHMRFRQPVSQQAIQLLAIPHTYMI